MLPDRGLHYGEDSQCWYLGVRFGSRFWTKTLSAGLGMSEFSRPGSEVLPEISVCVVMDYWVVQAAH